MMNFVHYCHAYLSQDLFTTDAHYHNWRANIVGIPYSWVSGAVPSTKGNILTGHLNQNICFSQYSYGTVLSSGKIVTISGGPQPDHFWRPFVGWEVQVPRRSPAYDINVKTAVDDWPDWVGGKLKNSFDMTWEPMENTRFTGKRPTSSTPLKLVDSLGCQLLKPYYYFFVRNANKLKILAFVPRKTYKSSRCNIMTSKEFASFRFGRNIPNSTEMIFTYIPGKWLSIKHWNHITPWGLGKTWRTQSPAWVVKERIA